MENTFENVYRIIFAPSCAHKLPPAFGGVSIMESVYKHRCDVYMYMYICMHVCVCVCVCVRVCVCA